jgi:hypothetical protein
MERRAYSYEELGAIKRQVLDICEQVARDNPTAWRQAHNGNFDETISVSRPCARRASMPAATASAAAISEAMMCSSLA